MKSPPRLDVYSPRKVDFDREERTLRTLVGVAFRHRNGDGYNIVINGNTAVHNELVLFLPYGHDSRPAGKSRPTQSAPATAPLAPPDDG